jgi:hypothetical protein
MANEVRLLDLQKLDVEDESAVGGNTWHLLAAIGQVGGNGKSSFATNGHANDTNVPSINDLARTESEGECFALLVCY